MRTRHLLACTVSFAASVAILAPLHAADTPATPATTRPATSRPATTQPVKPDPKTMSSDQMLGQMLRPATPSQPKPLQPLVDVPTTDKTSGAGAVKPNAPAVATLREGTYIIDRVGRLEKTPDGSQSQFVFEADGKSLREPPLVIVPNLKLMMMETAVTGATRDLKFRVSGMITEYKGRNYVLLEKVFVVPDPTQF
ncbi:hypothetical protein [Humisphaera borealis]|uniref:Uncharacterized protein n=1 Tax=Humisphaera borealis TaxID=2807512 RepID=A0A7M2WZC3_9BACT|nr:hypothetical protein [Humisphaera borealis]QOV89840.1 hypothetical protein IPV69_00245 [Humisphaera borealis]